MYSHGILIVFVVLLAKCLKRLTNARTPYALVYMMAAHSAFDYELVTRGVFVLGPSAMFHSLFSRSKMALLRLSVKYMLFQVR